MDISIFTALAEPNRLRMVELLREGPLTVGDLSERTGLRQPQASKHLRVLLEAGIVEVRAEANRRYYKLRPEPFLALDAWVDMYCRIWKERFDRLEEYLHQYLNQTNRRER